MKEMTLNAKPPMTPDEMMAEAGKITSIDRQQHYGPPLANHSCTAKMWEAYVHRALSAHGKVTARDVCNMNILQKLSRDANLPKDDNDVDVIGYILNKAMMR